MYRYEIKDLSLIINDTASGVVTWQGKPMDCPVQKILPITDPSGCVVLLSYEGFRSGEHHYKGNVLFIKPTGEIAWQLELLSSHDVYSEINDTEQGTTAYSWDGFLVHIDVHTGKITDYQFTK